ncbi:hypothetical protein ABW19_dt0202415 [Dactylella cylindrospora]|nr:hypothetical protein ABW19_dt0202415 [Dactylella cylindrospora]
MDKPFSSYFGSVTSDGRSKYFAKEYQEVQPGEEKQSARRHTARTSCRASPQRNREIIHIEYPSCQNLNSLPPYATNNALSAHSSKPERLSDVEQDIGIPVNKLKGKQLQPSQNRRKSIGDIAEIPRKAEKAFTGNQDPKVEVAGNSAALSLRPTNVRTRSSSLGTLQADNYRYDVWDGGGNPTVIVDPSKSPSKSDPEGREVIEDKDSGVSLAYNPAEYIKPVRKGCKRSYLLRSNEKRAPTYTEAKDTTKNKTSKVSDLNGAVELYVEVPPISVEQRNDYTKFPEVDAATVSMVRPPGNRPDMDAQVTGRGGMRLTNIGMGEPTEGVRGNLSVNKAGGPTTERESTQAGMPVDQQPNLQARILIRARVSSKSTSPAMGDSHSIDSGNPHPIQVELLASSSPPYTMPKSDIRPTEQNFSSRETVMDERKFREIYGDNFNKLEYARWSHTPKDRRKGVTYHLAIRNIRDFGRWDAILPSQAQSECDASLKRASDKQEKEEKKNKRLKKEREKRKKRKEEKRRSKEKKAYDRGERKTMGGRRKYKTEGLETDNINEEDTQCPVREGDAIETDTAGDRKNQKDMHRERRRRKKELRKLRRQEEREKRDATGPTRKNDASLEVLGKQSLEHADRNAVGHENGEGVAQAVPCESVRRPTPSVLGRLETKSALKPMEFPRQKSSASPVQVGVLADTAPGPLTTLTTAKTSNGGPTAGECSPRSSEARTRRQLKTTLSPSDGIAHPSTGTGGTPGTRTSITVATPKVGEVVKNRSGSTNDDAQSPLAGIPQGIGAGASKPQRSTKRKAKTPKQENSKKTRLGEQLPALSVNTELEKGMFADGGIEVHTIATCSGEENAQLKNRHRNKTAPPTTPPAQCDIAIISSSDTLCTLEETFLKDTDCNRLNLSPLKKASGKVPAGTSVIVPPPLHELKFGLVQEEVKGNPYKLLVAVTFLQKTKGTQALPVFWNFLQKWPTPQALLKTGTLEKVTEVFRVLGLQNGRANAVWELATRFVLDNPCKRPLGPKGWVIKASYRPPDPSGMNRRWGCVIGDIRGFGKYAIDSWRIFAMRPGQGGFIDGTSWDRPMRQKRQEAPEEPEPPNLKYPKRFAPGDEEWRRIPVDDLVLDKELKAYVAWMHAKDAAGYGSVDY